MMNDALGLALALVAGILLGAVFFGGLWWTIQRGLLSRRPALWFLGSLLVRTTIALSGFCCLARGHWERLLVGLIGFAVARLIVTWLIPAAEKPASLAQEVSHAP